MVKRCKDLLDTNYCMCASGKILMNLCTYIESGQRRFFSWRFWKRVYGKILKFCNKRHYDEFNENNGNFNSEIISGYHEIRVTFVILNAIHCILSQF